MDVESLAKQLILQNMTPEQQTAVLESVRATLQEARGNQKRRVSENVGAVVDALKKIEADIRAKYDDLGNKITARVNSIRDGRDGTNGSDGRDGVDGRPGRDGAQGPAGPAGRDGVNGVDGVDGVSVTDAKIDFDGSLVISLSNGREINVGEVVAPDLAERIKVITNGGGTSQTVIDTLASLQQQINDLIPSQTGNAGKFLTTDGADLTWASVTGSGLTYQGTWNASTNTPTLASGTGTSGYYYVVSVAGSTDLDGVTDWQPGDWVVFNGTAWQKIDQSWAIAGANDNITSMTGITGGISSPDFIQFDTTATVTDATGKLYYNDEDMYQTLAFQMNGNIIQHVGEELFYRVKLSSAATKGQVLMFTGTLGASGGLTAAPATGLTFEQSNYILGVAGESGITNDWITVYEFGEVKNVDTSAFSQGDVLYYDPTVAGGLTDTKPNTPNAIAVIAAVVHVGVSNGVLFVRPTFGSALGSTDGNVRFATLASGNTIIYDAVDGVWKNANLTDGTGISITEGAGSITIANSGVTSIAGTTNEVDVSASTGSITLSLPATINADTTGNAATVTNGAYVNAANTFSTNQVISVNSSTDALRITQVGSGNALLVEDSTNPDSSPFVIDANGRVMQGVTSTTFPTEFAGAELAMTRATNNGNAFIQYARKARGSIGSESVVLSGDDLFSLQMYGYDGAGYIEAARILAEIDGTPGTNDMPGRLVFSTTADGASSPTERMRIDNAGNVGIGITPTQKLHVSGNILATGSVDCGTQFLGLSTDSATAPSFSFTGDENTGMYRPGADQVALTVNGNARLTVSTSQFTGTLPWRGQNGSAAAPAISASADTNTGIYFPAADTLAFVEGGSEVMRINSSGNVGIGDTTPSYKLDVTGDINVTGDFRKNGTVFAGLTGGQTGSAPLYGARAWVNFNGTGTVAIRASGNVSSITDNGTGDYTVNFTNAMPDVNYSPQITSGWTPGVDNSSFSGVRANGITTTTMRFSNVNNSDSAYDSTNLNVAIFR